MVAAVKARLPAEMAQWPAVMAQRPAEMAQDLLATRTHAHAVWRLRPGGPLLVNYALLDGVTFCAARPDGRCVDGAG